MVSIRYCATLSRPAQSPIAKFLQLPPYEKLHELFELDVTSPSGLRWKNTSCTRIKEGDPAGGKNDRGYWHVRIGHTLYKVHRILFYMRTGKDPGNQLIDHPDRIVSDNSSLRIANRSQNAANRVKSTYKQKATYSKFKGVTWHKGPKKWMSQIIVNGKKKQLGYFKTELEAAAAYNEAAIAAWGEFAVLNLLD